MPWSGLAGWRRIPQALVLCLLLSACASFDRSIALSELTVVPITAGEAAEVSADDLAEAMLRAGLSAEEVLQLGPALHSALASSGGAQLRQQRVVAALFVIHADELYVASRERGTFMQELGPDRPADPSA